MNFGDFILVSKNRINLPPDLFKGGPWVHLATVMRGFKEYVCLLHEPTQEVYIEEISATGEFSKIQDESLWQDLVKFLVSKGVVGFTKGKEVVQGVWNQ
jgi:hypothetical protein